jgi:ABC-type phosphate transport system substrate-binding protein
MPAQSEQSDIVVIGSPDVPKMSAETIAKIYTGKIISVNGISVKPVNSKSGTAIRNHFLQSFLNQDDEAYIAYWAVRRYIGKGTPPKELDSSADVIQFVQSTPGAIGYIEASDLGSDMNVVSSR